MEKKTEEAVRMTKAFTGALADEKARIEQALNGIGYRVTGVHIGNIGMNLLHFSIGVTPQNSPLSDSEVGEQTV
jgi:hypothetical protein